MLIGAVEVRDHLRDVGIDGELIYLTDIGFEAMDVIHLLEVIFQRQALMNTVMNFQAFTKGRKNFLL
jgi:hypothetical protein